MFTNRHYKFFFNFKKMFLKVSIIILLFSILLWYLHEQHTEQFMAATRNIPILTPFMIQIHSYFGRGHKKATGPVPERLFTKEELALCDGEKTDKLYICILGRVYDVASGRKHYETGSSYNVFVGQDASRAFVTGEFSNDKASDDVLDLALADMLSLNQWLEFYDKEYEYRGKLIGRYYTETGEKTSYHKSFEDKVREARAEKGDKEQQKRIFPPCNSEWSKEKGSRVWCTTRSGGIDRDWEGVPRKLYEVGSDRNKCVCIDLPRLQDSSSPQHSRRHNLGVYRDCHAESTSCYVYDDN